MQILTVTGNNTIADTIAIVVVSIIVGYFFFPLLWRKNPNTVPKKELDTAKAENQRLSVTIARLESTLDSERTAYARERETMVSDRERIADIFKSVGSEVLKEALNITDERSSQNNKFQNTKIQEVLGPIVDATTEMKTRIHEIETARIGSYERLTSRVESLGQTEDALSERIATLGATTSGLAQAIRNPVSRGNWGEYHLRRIIELGGMVEHCDFLEQETITTEEGSNRPDVTVIISENYRVFIDAKTPLNAYLEAADAVDDRIKNEANKRHLMAVKNHLRTLASRNYAKKEHRSSQMVIMYVPSEGALSSAIAQDKDLIEEALSLNIILAGPMQLLALLRMFAFDWRQRQFDKNADKVIILAKEFVERVAVFGAHMSEMQKSIINLTKNYNAVAGSAESRILVTARKLTALGAEEQQNVQMPLKTIDEMPRMLVSPELTGSDNL